MAKYHDYMYGFANASAILLDKQQIILDGELSGVFELERFQNIHAIDMNCQNIDYFVHREKHAIGQSSSQAP